MRDLEAGSIWEHYTGCRAVVVCVSRDEVILDLPQGARYWPKHVFSYQWKRWST